MANDVSSDSKAGGLKALSNEHEPQDEFRTLRDATRQLISESPSPELMDLLPKLVSSLLSSFKHDQTSIEVVGEFLLAVQSSLPKLIGEPKYQEALKASVELDRVFYKSVAQEDSLEARYIPAEPELDPFEEWRQTLEPGTAVDAVKIDSAFQRMSWARATVLSVEGGKVTLSYKEEDRNYDRQLPITSPDIAPSGTYADEAWRENIRLGTLVDAFDSYRNWYNSTVLAVREDVTTRGEKHIMLQIGYRIYEPTGTKHDERGCFRGWSDRFDEWICSRSPRLAPYNTNARLWPIPPIQFVEEKEIEDSNDIIIRSPKAYFVTRPPKFRSRVLVSNLNKLADKGIIEAAISIVETTQAFDIFAAALEFLSKISPLYHKNFAREVVRRTTASFTKFLLDSPENQLRTFNKEKIDKLCSVFEVLLKRKMTIQEKDLFLDTFKLDFALKLMASQLLDKRIQGIKALGEVIRNSRFYPNMRLLKASTLAEKLIERNTLENIFGAQSHHELTQRSTDIIRLLATENLLNTTHLNLIWNASLTFEETRMTVFKMLGEASTSLRPDQLIFLLEKLAAVPPAQCTKSEVNLIHEITRYPMRAGAAANKAVDLFWVIMVSGQPYSHEVKQLALENFSALMKCFELKKYRQSVLNNCADKIRENSAVIFSIKVIKKILESYPVTATQVDPLNREAIIDLSVREHQVLIAFFDNLAHFKIQSKAFRDRYLEEHPTSTVLAMDQALKSTDFGDGWTYSEEVTERLNFLLQVLTDSRNYLPMHSMETLWKHFFTNAICESEQDIFLKWLNDISASQARGYSVFDDSEVHIFFRHHIADSINEFISLSGKAFKVFSSFFLLANISLKRLRKVNYFISSQESPGYYSYYNAIELPDPELFEYKSIAKPSELEGMDSLRTICLTAPESQAEEAIEFLNMIYDNLDDALGPQIVEIRQELIDYCLTAINHGELLTTKRALRLLKQFIEESEKRGTGSLQPYSCLLKGEVHKITVTNAITYVVNNTEIPKKIELTVYSSTTLWQVRQLISQKARVLWDQLRVVRNIPRVELKDSDNCKTMSELRIRSSEGFTVIRRPSNLPRVGLLNPEGGVSDQMQKIVKRWYRQFAEEPDRMSQEACAKFTNSCLGEPTKNISRIKEIFADYDSDRDGFLTEADFTEFYLHACINKPQVVWTNVYAHNYRNDLKNYEDGPEALDEGALPAYMLTQSQEKLDKLFESLNWPEVADLAWELLIKLPTNPVLYKQTLSLDQLQELFGTPSPYKLLYVLQIVQSLLEDQTDTEWHTSFVLRGGFDALLKIILSAETVSKQSLAASLSILSYFILAAFAAEEPEVSDAMVLVRKSSTVGDSPSKEVEFDLKALGTSPEEQASLLSEIKVSEASDKPTHLDDLAKTLKQANLSSSMIDSIDFTALLSRIISIIINSLQVKEIESEERRVIDTALELFVSCLLHNNSLLLTFFSLPEQLVQDDFTVKGLTCPQTIIIRKGFSQAILQVCLHVKCPSQPPLPYFVSMLLKKMPVEAGDTNQADYTQYFELLCNLVDNDFTTSDETYEELANGLLQKIMSFPSKERRNTALSDRVLVGYLLLAEKLFAKVPKMRADSFILEGFKQLLFPPQRNYEGLTFEDVNRAELDADAPKCKGSQSRAAAYKLFVTIAAGKPDCLLSLAQSLDSATQNIDVPSTWSYSPSIETRSPLGYAGIINIGNVCYANSILQQFFMIPQLRYSILAIDDQTPPTNIGVTNAKDWTELVDDNILHQIQRLFGALEYTERHAYNPKPFYFSCKDYENKPVNTALQADAQEFLNLILLRLENALKPTEHSQLLQGVLGGKTCSLMICKECNTTLERQEDFYSLSLDVKHSKTLEQSLDRLIADDTINDFLCETCDKKVDIVKRTLLKDLPNILVVHLQRIVFDFDTFNNVKINTRLEFPHNLDLKKFTKKGLEAKEDDILDPDEFSYELVGIVVHTGTADSGHYYSYCRQRRPDGTSDPQKWIELNDSVVKNFDKDKIESECYGGVDESDTNWVKFENNKNAYMLVYERKLKTPLTVGDEARDFNDLRKTLPPSVFQEVSADNDKFLRERHLFNLDFFKFLETFLNASASENLDVADLGTRLALTVTVRTYNNTKALPEVMKALMAVYNVSVEACENRLQSILDTSLLDLSALLLLPSEPTTRRCVAELLLFIINKVIPYDFSIESKPRKVLDALLGLVNTDVAKNWMRFEQFWEFFNSFANSGVRHVEYLYEVDAATLLADFYLGSKSPLHKPGQTRPTVGSKVTKAEFGPLLQTLSTLVAFAAIKQDDPGLILSEEAIRILSSKEFYGKSLSCGYDCDALGKIAAKICYNDLDISLMLIELVLNELNKVDYEEIKPYFQVIRHLLAVDDDNTICRFENILGVSTLLSLRRVDTVHPYYGNSVITAIDDDAVVYRSPYNRATNAYDHSDCLLQLLWKHRKRYEHYTALGLKFLLQFCTENPGLKKYIAEIPPPSYQLSRYTDWILKFAEDYKNSGSSWVYAGLPKREDLAKDLQELYCKVIDWLAPQPVRYIIGKALSCESWTDFEEDEVSVKIRTIRTQWVESKPDGKLNQSLPGKVPRAELYTPAVGTVNYKKPSSLGDVEMTTITSGFEDMDLNEEFDKFDYTKLDLFADNEYKPEVAAPPPVKDSNQTKKATSASPYVESAAFSNEGETVLWIEARNNQNQEVLVEIQIGEANAWTPKSKLVIGLSGDSVKDISFEKKDFSEHWGELWFNISLIKKKEEILAIEYGPIEPSSNITMNDLIPDEGDLDVPAGFKACPTCTLFNPSSCFRCDACGHIFTVNTSI
mmetsp:Transcript_8203/g.16159  ORF Transcript_8203/g.16159 Transcript_8203/m.16159 type:complete len:2815 (-) Transcript_8203:1874-10318(-)